MSHFEPVVTTVPAPPARADLRTLVNARRDWITAVDRAVHARAHAHNLEAEAQAAAIVYGGEQWEQEDAYVFMRAERDAHVADKHAAEAEAAAARAQSAYIAATASRPTARTEARWQADASAGPGPAR